MLMLFVVLSGISTTQVAGLQGSRSIQTTGIIDYPSFKIGIYVSSWDFHEYNADTIAETFDMSQSWWVNWADPWYNNYSAKIDQVHALNPNYKFLLYRNCMSIYDYWVDEWNYAQSQGWLLKDINGSYVTESNWGWSENYMVDITNPAYQQWLGAKVKSWLDQHPEFDGVMADNSLKYSAQEFEGASKNRPINPRTGTYFTDTEILDGCAGMLNAIIDAIGTSKLLMPNGIWNGAIWWNTWFGGDNYRYILSKVPRLNCLGSEGTFMAGGYWYSESLWKNSVDFVVWVQDNFLSGHPERRFSGACLTYALPPGATPEQVIEYGYCSMLLAIKYSSPQNTIDFGFSQDFLPNSNQLQLLQKLRSVDMNEPLGDYYKINSTAVYARDFVRGKVLVNPSDVSYIITLDGSYATIEGTIVSGSLTVYAHTGVILFR
jgi:hypothetical protein